MAEITAPKGHVHPISRVIDDLVKVFADQGFSVASGPEIEDEFHNFDALNVPKDHPARDMQDTFWIADVPKLLRTHTSNVQIRYMKDEGHKPPLKIVVPGKVFRNETTDRTHEVQFHQMEGLCVGEGISMAHLKHALLSFAKALWGDSTKIQLRPSYFPFVEPGIELAASCFACGGKGCSTCKGSGWVEILGAGMVHPNVLNAVGINPRLYTGFAFGMGVDRIAMMKYGIDDIRVLYSGDLRVVNQF
ncbi:MAG TPA: phenylalanine--tRNA ligase subunit alpha [Candidatus Paceibacterota bacterium]